MAKDLLEAQATQAEPKDLLAPEKPQVGASPVEQRSVYVAEHDLLINHPVTMSYDQVNDAIQTDVYKRPRFNFYEDVAAPFAQAGLPGVAARAGQQAALESGAKAITEPAKGVLRGVEQQVAMAGSLSRWFGENLGRQAELNDVKDSLGGKVAENMTKWGQKHYEYWSQQQLSGVEAPDPELFRGSFVSNPSWTRALTLVAEAIPSLATAAGITFLTKNPTAGAAALGLTQGSEEATKALDAGAGLDTANVVGVTNTVMLTLLEKYSLGSFLKGEGIIKGAIKEALPEGTQQAVTNIIAKIGYDKARNLMDGVLESLIAGAGSGGILGGLTKGRGTEIDAEIQDAHKAGVEYSDLKTIRDGQQSVVIANAKDIEGMLSREAAAEAAKIELAPAEEEADLARQKELSTIEALIEEQKAAPEVDEEAVAALEEMKRKRELDAPESATLTELKDIQEKINDFNSKGEKVPDSLVKRQEAILKGLESPETQGQPLKKSAIRAAVGMDDTSRKRMVSEMQSLKADLRAQARGAKAGFRAGREAERAQMIEKIQAGKLNQATLIAYVNERLPKAERGRFISMVQNAGANTDLGKAFARVDAAEHDFTRKTLINDIKKQLDKAAGSKNISIDIKKAIESLGSLFDTTVPRAETLKRLKATEDFVKAEIAKGNNVEVPQYILEELQRLKKIPLNELQTDGLYYLANNIRDAIELGKTKLQTRQAILELQKENMLTRLKQGTVHKAVYKKVNDGGIAGELQLDEKFKNVFRNIRNYNIKAGNAMLPMDHFFESLGEAYKTEIKRPMDMKWGTYRRDYSKVSQDVMELNEKLDLDEGNFRRIAVHLINSQETGYEKLTNTFPKAQVDAALATPLTKAEQEMANLWRKKLEEVRPALADFMRRVHNKDLKEVAGYYPFKTDFDKTQDLNVGDRLLENFGLKKNIELGFTEERTGAGEQKVRIDGLNVFLEHMDDALYAVHLGEHIKTMQELVRSDRFAATAGDAAQFLTAEWLDLMARKGGVQGNTARGVVDFLNYIRHTTGRAQLALNPSSILVQGAALLDGAGLIGNWAFQGAKDIWSPEWRVFVKQNSPAIAQRMGDDPAFQEFAQDQFSQAVFAPTRWTDGKTATAVFIGAYQKYLSDHNLPMDFTKPNNEAVLYAEEIVTKTQGGGQFKDLPLMITKGIGLGGLPAWSKTVTQFQSPLFFKWANLTSTGARALKTGDYKLAAQIAMYNLVGTASEMMIRHAAKTAILVAVGAVLGVGFKEEEEKALLQEFFETMLGNIPMVGNAVSLFAYEKMPAPSLNAAFSFVESAHNVIASEDPDKKAKWLANAVLQLAGVGFGVPLTFKAASINKQIEA